MNKKPYRDILDSAAVDSLLQKTNLWPRIESRLEQRSSFMQTLRARPALALIIILLALSLLTGVVYAIGKSLGYIPGVGIIDQSVAIRVLAEPVSMTRDGITLTVTDAVLAADKTVILFTLENVPWSALSHDENVGGCSGMAELRLLDGTVLQIVEGGGSMGKTRFVYAPIPAEVNEAVFVLPCILNTLPGLAPENWELSLRFIPAPPDMTVVPVIEIQSTPAPYTLTQAMQVGEDTILLGGLNWLELRSVRVSDANGQAVFTSFPTVEGLPNYDWGVQFKTNVAFPVTLTFEGVVVAQLAGSAAEFEFDAGENPQPGQEWTLNQPIQIGGRIVTLTTVRTDGQNVYSFRFTCDPDVTGLYLDIAGYTPNGGDGGGGYGLGQFSVSVAYPDLPKGKLRVALSNLTVASPPQTWTMQWSPESAPEAASLYGIVLKLDKFISLADGYYLIGHTEWTDARIKSVYPPGWIKATDASGRDIPLEPADWQEVGEALKPDQWVYRVYGKAFDGAITLRANQVGVEFTEPARLTLDLRPYNFTFSDEKLGMPYKTGMIPLDVPGLMATAFKAAYIKEGDMRGFEISMEADPRLLGLGFGIESGLNTAGMFMVGGGGGAYRDENTGLLLARILTNAPMSFPLVFAAHEAQIGGHWTVEWNPPAAEAGATPVYMPQACVTLEKWKQAVGSPPAIPPGVPQTVLVSRGALSPEPSLYISSLDGSGEQALVFGNGSLSPDGQKLVYGDENNRLLVLDIASGQKTPLTDGMSPFWSPDGSWIAFSRITDKGVNIYVLNVYKGSPRALTDTTDNPMLAGWMPDSKKVIVTTVRQAQSIEIASGETQNLMETQIENYSNVSISPDGIWIAFADKVIGRMTPGIFIARLDGSGKRLLVQLDYWMALNPIWSPDGKWLTFNVINTDQFQPTTVPALVNVDTCQVVPLTGLNGEIRGWVSP